MQQESKIQKKETGRGQEIERASERAVYTPSVDIYEMDDHFLVVADLPGVDEKSVDITLEKRTLTINGRVADAMPEGFQLRHSEYGVSDYQRSFSLSEDVDDSNINATVKDGVLRLKLNKKEPTTKKINVKVG